MAIVQSLSKEMSEHQAQVETPKYRVTPNYTAWIGDNNFILQVTLPGVALKRIKMKALKDFFMLQAERDNIIYGLELNLNFEVDPKKTKASYHEGLLRVEFELLDPLANAYTVPIK
jgi:HSP20 family molecular chaperone IbpA